MIRATVLYIRMCTYIPYMYLHSEPTAVRLIDKRITDSVRSVS